MSPSFESLHRLCKAEVPAKISCAAELWLPPAGSLGLFCLNTYRWRARISISTGEPRLVPIPGNYEAYMHETCSPPA